MEMFERGAPERKSRALLVKPDSSRKPALRTDASDYAKLCTEGRLVADKTYFLMELCQMGELVRITLPRRMGKTILLTMLKSFCEMPGGVRYGTTENPVEKSQNYDLFKDTLIFEDAEFVKEFFGAYPTVYLSLHNVSCKNFDQFVKKFASAIQKVYEEFSYLLEKVDRDDHRQFIKKVQESKNQLTDEELQTSILTLTEMLHRYHGAKVYVLIDEYDWPINSSRQNCLSENERAEIVAFHEEFLTATFKSNTHLKQGIVAGIMRFSSGKQISSVTYEECNLAKKTRLSRYFGFSEKLVEDLAEKIEGELFHNNFKFDGEHLKLAMDWYNGFFFDEAEEKFYNAYSMAFFLNNYPRSGREALRCYWAVESATTANIAEALKRTEIADNIELIIKYTDGNSEDTAHFDLIEEFTSKHYEELQNLCGEHYAYTNESKDIVLSYLCHMGYIAWNNGFPKIPNIEAKIFLKEKLKKYTEKKYSFDAALTDAVVDQLVKLIKNMEKDPNKNNINTVDLRIAFQNFHKEKNIIGKLFQGEIPNESFSHAMLTYMTLRIYNLHNKSLIHDKGLKNAENKEMRPDIAFDYSKTKAIIELKYHKYGTLDQALEEAKYYQYKLFNSVRADILHRILIGVHVTIDGTVTIKHEYQDGQEETPDMEIPKKFK